MSADIFKIVGQVAGIGGIALIVLMILFKDIINKKIFPSLTKKQTFQLFLLIVILTGTIAMLGIGAWVYSLKLR